jgi:hypothetical protein
LFQPRLFERDCVVVVEIVEANNLVAALEQDSRSVKANEAGCAGKEDFHERKALGVRG